MQPCKILLLGAGNFGASWANDVIPRCSDIAVFSAVVDKNPERQKHISPDIPFYTDLNEALYAVQPHLVINATAPSAHTALNRHLMKMGYPVLCEKPIAEDPTEAEEMLSFYEKQGGFLMIADNYRYSPVMRKCREIIASGKLGKIHNVQCRFRHYHPDYSAFYHGKLSQPLLLDVSIHHLDGARYLMGEEPLKTTCHTWTAPYTWYDSRPANASIHSEMTNDVHFDYFGTLAAAAGTTDWNGDWDIECQGGTLLIRESKLYLYDRPEGEAVPVPFCEPGEDSRIPMLREAISALQAGRKGETDLSDNIKTYRWLQSAIQAAEK